MIHEPLHPHQMNPERAGANAGKGLPHGWASRDSQTQGRDSNNTLSVQRGVFTSASFLQECCQARPLVWDSVPKTSCESPRIQVGLPQPRRGRRSDAKGSDLNLKNLTQ